MLEAAEIERMSVQEKVQALEQLWDSLVHEEESVQSPGWHAELLAVRKRRALSGESKFLTLDQLQTRLRGE